MNMVVKISILWPCMMILTLLGQNSVDGKGLAGLNWGRKSYTRRLPAAGMVEEMLRSGFSEVKFNDEDKVAMEAVRFAPVKISMTVPNDELQLITNLEEAKAWVEGHIAKYNRAQGYNFRYLAVGDEPLSKSFKNQTFEEAFDVLPLIQEALEYHNLSNVKATIPHFTDVMTLTNRPSEAVFRADLKPRIVESLKFLDQSKAPFMLDIFPLWSLDRQGWPLELGLFQKLESSAIRDGNFTYYNIFDFMVDACYFALADAGFPRMEIVVGRIGWPSEGIELKKVNMIPEMNVKFYRAFLKYLASKEGTPRKRGQGIQVFFHCLVDEWSVSRLDGDYERHFGFFRPDGSRKMFISVSETNHYAKIDVSGLTRNQKLPPQWCIFNGDTSDMNKVNMGKEIACASGDCSPLGPDGFCGQMAFERQISYAFNLYFQSQNQQFEACDFDGLGKVVTSDPSRAEEYCTFPTFIVRDASGY